MREDLRAGSPAARGGALLATLLALLAWAGCVQWFYQPPVPRAADAPADSFSAQRAALVLQELTGTGLPHPLASSADALWRARIVRQLTAVGLVPELQTGWSCDTTFVCGLAVNIVARIDGTDPDSGAVLLAAHYDSVPAGPGAGDDGSGVAAILEVARALKHRPAPRHPIILLIDEGEEAGLLGARLFVAAHPAAHTVKAAVNLDARGDSGPSLMFETGTATAWTMRLYAHAVSQPMSNSLYYFVYKLLPNDTDFTVFKAAGYQGFNFAMIGDVERYHTPLDRLENLDLGSLQHQGDNALGTVAALAMSEFPQPDPAGAVFFDVLGRTLIQWPASWAPLLGSALGVTLLLALWQIKRRVGVSAGSIAWSLGALLTGWLGMAGIAVCLLVLLRFTGAVPAALAYSWAAHPLGMHAACVALALLAPACAARLYARRTGSWSLWLAAVLLYTALLLLSSLKFPELSFLFVIPALASLAVAWLALRQLRRRQSAPHPAATMPAWVAAPPVLAAALVFIPSLLLTYSALGADAWPIITATLGLALLTLAPMLADASATNYRLYAAIAVVTVLVGAGSSAAQRPYSVQSPQRTLLWYALDGDAGTAQWLVKTDSHRLHTEFSQAAPFTNRPQSVPALSVYKAFVAPAPTLPLPVPKLEVLSVEHTAAGTTVYDVRISSPRAAPELELALPRELAVQSISLLTAGAELVVQPWRAPDQTGWLKFIGAPPQGLELRVRIAGDAHVAVGLLDRSYGLPAAVAALQAKRPAATTTSQDGDLTIVSASARLSPP